MSRENPCFYDADELEGEVMQLLQQALAQSTIQNYTKTWFDFQLFIIEVLQEPLSMPCTVQQVAKYVTTLWKRGLCHSTIASTLSVITFAHKMRELPDPASAFFIRKLLLAVKKSARPKRPRMPITAELLTTLISILRSGDMSGWDSQLMETILIMLYVGGLRIGELIVSGKDSPHTLQMNQLYAELNAGSLIAYVMRMDHYKHSGDDIAWIKFQRRQGILCPVQSIRRYLDMRGSQPGVVQSRQFQQLP